MFVGNDGKENIGKVCNGLVEFYIDESVCLRYYFFYRIVGLVLVSRDVIFRK